MVSVLGLLKSGFRYMRSYCDFDHGAATLEYHAPDTGHDTVVVIFIDVIPGILHWY